jgi:cytochrome c551
MTLFLVLLACSGGKDSASGTADAANGATLYSNSCEGCHGADGTLGVDIGGSPAADLNVEVPEQSDDELTNVMIDGFGNMPSQFTDPQDAADCLAYLRETFP